MKTEVFDTNDLPKTYFKMSLPVVMGLVVTLIYNLADTIFVGQTGNTALVAGVSLCSPVFTTIMAFGNIYGQGGSSLISRLLGKKDKEAIHHVSSFCFYIAIFTGIVLGLLMMLFQTPLLTLIGAKEDTMSFAREYFTILAIGSPIIILSFIHSNLLRCEGMSLQSMIGTIAGAVFNIILDPILILNFDMGAGGAAIATVLGYFVSNVYFIFVVVRKSDWLSINFKHFRISLAEFKQILGVGMTAAITNIAQSMCIIVMNQFLLPYGSDKIAAMGIVLKVNMIAQLVLTGFSFGAVPLFGYLYGSKNQRKLKDLTVFCLKFLTGLSLLLTIGIFIASPMLMKLMMDNASIIADGTIMLRWQILGTVLASIVLLMTCLFQAVGKVVPAFLLSISRQGVLFIIVIFVCVKIFGYQGVLVSQVIADLLGALLAIILYRQVILTKTAS